MQLVSNILLYYTILLQSYVLPPSPLTTTTTKLFLHVYTVTDLAYRFCRQFCDLDSLELSKFSAAQFMEVCEPYNSDGKQYSIVLINIWPSPLPFQPPPTFFYNCTLFLGLPIDFVSNFVIQIRSNWKRSSLLNLWVSGNITIQTVNNISLYTCKVMSFPPPLPTTTKLFLNTYTVSGLAYRFCRQFHDSDLLELKKLSAAQFTEVRELYNPDGKQYSMVMLKGLPIGYL